MLHIVLGEEVFYTMEKGLAPGNILLKGRDFCEGIQRYLTTS